MTTTSWKTGVNGDFNTASDWTAGVPAAGDTALITAKGTYLVISAAIVNSVAVLNMAKGAELEINDLDVGITEGTGKGALAGHIAVTQGTSLVLGAAAATTTFNQTGVVYLEGSSKFASDLVIQGTVTLSGSGTIEPLDQNCQIIASGSATLNNGNKIESSGNGTIGDTTHALTLNNAAKGIINTFSPSGGLAIEVSSSSTNSGLIEATDAGVLTIGNSGKSSLITQTAHGKIEANGGRIILDATAIMNGLVSVLKNSRLEVTDGSNAIDTSLANAAVVTVDNGAVLDVSGAIKNTSTGAVVVDGELVAKAAVTGGTVTFGGQSEVDLEAAASANVNFLGSSPGTLVLDDAPKFTGTISGMATNPGASIVLSNIGFADAITLTYAKGVLTVADATKKITDKIKIAGAGTFTHQQYGTTGELQIFDPPATAANIPNGSTQLLAQSMAAFGAGSGVAGSGMAGADRDNASDFLAANSAHHHG